MGAALLDKTSADQVLETFLERFRDLMVIAACGPETELVELTGAARQEEMEKKAAEREKLAGALAIAPGSEGLVVVHNRYKTWEPFFVALHPPEAGHAWAVEPWQGTLAPRGGANNVCDPSKPYSDTQTLAVRCCGGEVGDEALLVVGTEEEQWTYSLCVVEVDRAGPAPLRAAHLEL